MMTIENLPSVVINDLVLYMQGIRECDWEGRCKTATALQIDNEMREGKYPKALHDLMISATVFGDPRKSSEVMNSWMKNLPEDSWQRWFDAKNVSSSIKRCYGHEALRRSFNGSDPRESPMGKLLLEAGYLRAARGRNGPLESLLLHPSGNVTEDTALLDLMLRAESQAPGSCITKEACEALTHSSLKSSALVKTIAHGVNLETWIAEPGKNPALEAELNTLRLSVDARRAAEIAVAEVAGVTLQTRIG